MEFATALLIMMIGMAGVGSFLTVLVLVMLGITRLAAPKDERVTATSSVTAKQDAGADLALIAVVQAVVAAYESEQQDLAATEGVP